MLLLYSYPICLIFLFLFLSLIISKFVNRIEGLESDIQVYLIETDIHDQEVGPVCLCNDNLYLEAPCSQQLKDFYKLYNRVYYPKMNYILKCYKRA